MQCPEIYIKTERNSRPWILQQNIVEVFCMGILRENNR